MMLPRERRTDTTSAIAVIVIAAGFFIAGWREPAARFDPLGSGTAAMVVAVILAALAIVLLLRTLLGKTIGQSQQSLIVGLDESPQDNKPRIDLTLILACATLLYAFAWEKNFPFIASTTAYLAALGWLLGERSRKRALIALLVAVAATAIMEFVFRRVFTVALP
jgi:lysylphosphatidylglycerol synthetase-like protein (DUF2156 family)